jgi:outer membrane lipopolysaccharide assembly protein LptE/RlpB
MIAAIKRVSLVAVCVVMNACGYTLQGSGTVLPPDVKAIFIPKVQNNSTELGLSDIVTEALREQFESYGVVSVVDRQSLADAVLNVKILNVTRTTRTVLGANDTATQMETTMVLEGELRRTTGPLLWKNSMIRVAKGVGTDRSSVVTSSAAFASGSISSTDLQSLSSREITRSQENEILPNLAAEAARTIYDGSVAPDF